MVGSEPRCPADGEPMYGWVRVGGRAGDDETGFVIDRCERCGLGMTRPLGVAAAAANGRPPVALADLPHSPDPDATLERAREQLGGAASVEFRVPNRNSLQAGIGGEQWAALEVPPQRLHLTPRSLELMLGDHGLRATRMRQPAVGRNIGWMWQTLLNAFTFHTNFARDVIGGRLVPRNARSLLTFTVDAIVSTLAALPIMIIAVPLEIVAAAVRRGGELVVTVAAEGAAVPAADGGADRPLYHR